MTYQSSVPFDADRVGAAAVYCSDGRYGDQIDDLLHASLGLPRYDRLAMPGGAACLVPHVANFFERQAGAKHLEFLIKSHGLSRVVLIAHQDCVYYLHQLRVGPGEILRQQIQDLRQAAEIIRVLDADVAVQAFFARKQGDMICFEAVDVEG